MISFRKKSPSPSTAPVDLFSGSERNQTGSPFTEDLRRTVNANMRIKPSYADCWLIGRTADLDVIEEYDIPNGHVTIGTARDGEMEYNLVPSEYSATEFTDSVVKEAIAEVRERFLEEGGRMDRQAVYAIASEVLSDRMSEEGMSPNSDLGMDVGRVGDIVYRYSLGLGVFDILLSDPKLEDLYVDAPCEKNRIYVTMGSVKGSNSHIRCRTNLVADRNEVLNLINTLKRESGLPYCESNPVLECDMKAQDARATVVGYPMSPEGDAVAIRKHSNKTWTLTRLIANGTMDEGQAGLLSFLVQNRATFLICGARGAGKSSLLNAMLLEQSTSTRTIVIEDTREIECGTMRDLGYKVQSILVDERLQGDSSTRSADALRVSLRLGESAIVIGEVRGAEARVLYESMRTGKAGSSIMGTIHGDSAKTVFQRVVHDMGISPEAFMATDVLVTIGDYRDRRSGAKTRRVNEIVCTTDRPGEFVNLCADNLEFTTPVMRRALSSASMTEKEAIDEIKARGKLHGILAELGKEKEEFLSPKWIIEANETVARMTGKSPDEIENAFKVRIRDSGGRL